MNLFKSLSLATAAATLLALSAPVQAQNPEDLKTMQAFLGIMESYFGIIESTHDVNSNVEKAAIMQMQKIQEVYEQRGEKARAAEIFREVLKESRNPTIRNAAYMLLGDTLKETGQADEAIKLLRQGLAENIKAAGE